MKKVGIVSCYFKNNYGSMLQAYASQKILDDNKISNETIDINRLSDFSKGKKKYYLSQITNLGFIKAKLGMVKLKGYQKLNKNLNKNIQIRNSKFNEFKRNFKLTRAFNTYSELAEYAKDTYTDVIVGSDQLWLPINVVADYYTLNWVPKSINKMSYATSFGISKIPDKYEPMYASFLNKINNISVRESNAVEMVKKVSGRNVTLVCDPTLLLTKEQWMDIQKKDRLISEKYIFCYFLGNNIEHRKFVEKLKNKTGYKIVSINHCDEYVKYSDYFADFTPYDVGPGEFINYIRNAEYVCTDSFHGTVFSLINNVKFYTFRRFHKKTKMSTNSRVESLLEIVNLKDRLINGTEDVDELLLQTIDYKTVNEKIDEFRKASLEWLLNKITYKKSDCKHIEIDCKEDCCGCTACMNICPQKAIMMIKDKEGFQYPKVDKNKCIDCGLCKNVCPILNRVQPQKFEQIAYIFQNHNEKVRRESTSGGAFSAIAEYVIEKGGIVFGAAFDDKFYVKHQFAKTKEELAKFRNSKYVQSDPNTTFEDVKKNLNEGRMVCYSGTSCQISGLKKYLKREYENLVLVDIVCRAVPSPLMWEKYYKLRNSEYKSIEKIYFRDKYYGYKYSNLSIYTKNHKDYHIGIETDPYLRAFFSNILDRPSCYSCKFKTQYRESDITLWDCFEVENFDKKLDDDKGTTRVLVNSQKGKEIIEKLSKDNTVVEIDVGKALSDFNGIFSKVRVNPRHDEFVKDMNILSEKELFDKYFPNKLKNKIERFIRTKLAKTKIYKKILKIGKKIRKRR